MQVRLVHDFGDDLGAAILDPEPLDEGLERAVVAVMPELCTEHVEWDALARGVRGVGEGKFRLGVVEAPDEPGGGDPIDMRPRPGHPCAAGRRQRRPVAADRRVRACLHGAQALGRGLPKGARAPTDWRLQIVDGLDPVELPLDAIELAAKVRDGAPMTGPVAVELPEDLPASSLRSLILEGTRLVEQGSDLLGSHVPDPVDMQKRHLAMERFDLLHQPLKELRGFRSLRKDPGRAAEPHGSHALELPPDSDAVPGRCGRQCREKRQPTHKSQSNA